MGIFTKNQTGALDAATAELGKIQEAVSRETSKLTDLKSNLAAAERDYTSALGNEAVTGEVGSSQKAREHVVRCRGEVEEQAKRLSAARGKLWTTGIEAAAKIAEPRAEALASEKAAALKGFASEWENAVRSWAVVLTRRQEFERVTGQRLTLTAPEPAGAASVSDVLPIHAAIDALRSRLSSAAGIECTDAAPDETGLHASFEHNLRALEAADRSRRSQSRLEAAQAEGR